MGYTRRSPRTTSKDHFFSCEFRGLNSGPQSKRRAIHWFPGEPSPWSQRRDVKNIWQLSLSEKIHFRILENMIKFWGVCTQYCVSLVYTDPGFHSEKERGKEGRRERGREGEISHYLFPEKINILWHLGVYILNNQTALHLISLKALDMGDKCNYQ